MLVMVLMIKYFDFCDKNSKYTSFVSIGMSGCYVPALFKIWNVTIQLGTVQNLEYKNTIRNGPKFVA
jgi:hypothetical protein